MTTAELRGFTLDLAGHPGYAADRPLEIGIDEQRFILPPGMAPSFHRTGSLWESGRAPASDGAKRRGLEGPMSEVVASRHVYVYGTADEPSEEVLAARRAEAERAADWSVYRGPFWGRVMVFPRVVADRELRPSDLESAHLVLFGTRETNILIDRFADRLPLHLDPAAEGHGLAYVYPADGRYVLVASGLPWWTPGPSQDGLPFTNAVAALGLNGRPDYLLFEGSPENVVAQGRFDPEWRLAPEEAQRLSASGVVRGAALEKTGRNP